MEDRYINNQYQYSDITNNILSAAVQVHKKLGCGFKEAIYQKALAIEMNKLHLQFVKEIGMEIGYDNEIIGLRRVDFLVENRVMVEIKAIEKLEKVHQVQLLNYLRIYNLKVGLLINFGAIYKVEIKRMVL